MYTAVPPLIISVFVVLKVFPDLFFDEDVARHVPSNRLIELESDEPLDLCFAGADLGFEGASVGAGLSSEIGAGSRCAEIIRRVARQTAASARFIFPYSIKIPVRESMQELEGSAQDRYLNFICESAENHDVTVSLAVAHHLLPGSKRNHLMNLISAM